MKTLYSIFLIFLLSLTFTGYSQTAKEYFTRGYAKKDLQDYRGAIADYTKAIEINPKYLLAYRCRGIAKDFLKDNVGAIADYTKAIEIDPQDAEAFL